MRTLRIFLACWLGVFALPWSALSVPNSHDRGCCQHSAKPCACQTHCGCVMAPDQAPSPSKTQSLFAPVVSTLELPVLTWASPAVVTDPIEPKSALWLVTTGPRAPPGRAPPF